MKLDNIVYDIDSLRNAIVESWANDSPTFTAMYPSETTTALANLFAGYGAFLQYFVVSTMANCYTDTVFSREGIYQLAVTLGNVIHGNNSAQVLATFTKNNLISMNITIPAETTFVINGKKYFNPHGILLPAGVSTVTNIVLIQGEVLEITKTTSGIPYERFYFSSDFKVNHNYVRVYVNGEEWSVSDNFLDYEKNYVTDPNLTKMLVLRTDSDGRSFLKLGDGQLGDLPISGSTILIHYVSNDGEEGNTSEIGIEGTLENNLMFTDRYGNQQELDLSLVTTSTSYGGFGTQSLETLQMTSPWVFASGHRAVRRQDYIAMLTNQCGYITANVWGEYEQANKAGAYDSLMMNMVYYTGLKSFELYPYSSIGHIYNFYNFKGTIGSNRGFYGSYSLKMANKKSPDDFILMQDTGAKGFLFINNDDQDPRDSLLPDWEASINNNAFFVSLDSIPISNNGVDYKAGDVVYLGIYNEITNELIDSNLSVLITKVNSNGEVEEVKLQQRLTNCDYPWTPGTSYACEAIKTTGNGKDLIINVKTAITKLTRSLVKTNDLTDEPGAVQDNPIVYAKSNTTNSVWYQSIRTPSLLQPVQIIIDYRDSPDGEGLAGVKFQATSSHKFFGTFALYGTNSPNPSFDNIRNSEQWKRLIDKIDVERPSPQKDYWTNWYPTNCLTHTIDENGETKVTLEKYHLFVIEFYSTEETADSTQYEGYVHIDKIKMLYEEDCSYIDYDNNGTININFPVAGSPGPDFHDSKNLGFLDENLLNENNYLLYNYNVQIDGLTVDNGYKDGNILSYSYTKDGVSTTFLVKIVDIVNGSYSTTVRDKISSTGSTNLVGSNYIDTNVPVSLDNQATYKVDFQSIKFGDPDTGEGYGQYYRINDIITISNTDSQLRFKVTATDNFGGVLQAVWLNNILVDSQSEEVEKFINDYMNESSEHQGKNLPTTGGYGSGLTVNLEMELASGNGETPGEGGTIKISSEENVEVSVSFIGNRIDTQDINYLDQPTIEKYNHFTTYMEFVQPEVKQVEITIEASLSTSASVTSNMIIQEIKNNVNKLFEVTPDYLGRGLKLSDIYTAVMSTPNVKWCKVLEPVDNIEADVDGFLIPTYITINEVIKEYK